MENAKPDWKPIPQDYIPFPSMTPQKRRGCFDKTMRVNLQYQGDGYVPVIHIGHHLLQYTACLAASAALFEEAVHRQLGAIVPNLLRKLDAMAYSDILASRVPCSGKFRGQVDPRFRNRRNSHAASGGAGGV